MLDTFTTTHSNNLIQWWVVSIAISVCFCGRSSHVCRVSLNQSVSASVVLWRLTNKVLSRRLLEKLMLYCIVLMTLWKRSSSKRGSSSALFPNTSPMLCNLNPLASGTKAPYEVWLLSALYVGQSSVFLLWLLNQYLPVITYNILLFRGTPQQLEELFVARFDGKLGVESFSQWIRDTAPLGWTQHIQGELWQIHLAAEHLVLCLFQTDIYDTYDAVIWC